MRNSVVFAFFASPLPVLLPTLAWSPQINVPLGHPLFFLCLASSDRPKFLAFSKKKSNDVVKPFLSWNNSFYLKNGHTNGTENNRNKNMNIFLQYIVHFVNPNMWMLTFNVVLGYQGLLFRLLVIFFRVFFSIRPTDPISENAFDAKRKKKKGDGLSVEAKDCGKRRTFFSYCNHHQEPSSHELFSLSIYCQRAASRKCEAAA